MDVITFLRARLDAEQLDASLIPGNGILPAVWTAHRVPGGNWSEIRQHDRYGPDDHDPEVYTAGLMTWGRNEDQHVTRWDTNRIMAEIAVKREMIAAVERYLHPHPGQPCTNIDPDDGEKIPDESCDLHLARMATACTPYALIVLVQPYRDHPDFDPDWLRPIDRSVTA